MARISVNVENIIPSNPEVLDCPTFEMSGLTKINVIAPEITLHDTLVKYNGERVQGVLGPLSCDQCFRKCPDAYLILNNDELIKNATDAGFRRAETPVKIPFFDYNPRQESIQIPEVERTDGSTDVRLFGKAERENRIVNEIFELHEAAVVTTSDDGQLTLHHGSFQPELEFPVDAPSAITAESEPALGQQKLF